MKLRHKISLLAGAVLLLVLLTCAGVLLLYARKTILALAEDQARDKQSALSASFSSMVRYYAVPEDSDAARESLIRYCFTRFADQEGVLMRGGETLCSSVAVDPSLYALPDREDSRTAVYRGSVDGRQLLIVASLEWVQTDTLYVGLVRDITEVYDAMARLTRLFLGVCAAGVALGMGLLFLAVKKSTAPLSRLTAATGEIAAGAYDKRVTISGRDEVGDLGQSFNRMAEAVENKIADLTEQNERQRLFIGGVSHEFKTPLAAVGLHGDLLENAKLSETEREDSLQHIRRAGAYMTSMTQSLMELLLLDQEIETEKTDPAALLSIVSEAAHDGLAARGVTLVTACQAASPLPSGHDPRFPGSPRQKAACFPQTSRPVPYSVYSCQVYALLSSPMGNPLRRRNPCTSVVEGKCLLPLNIMCSTKWAMPSSFSSSTREPTLTTRRK